MTDQIAENDITILLNLAGRINQRLGWGCLVTFFGLCKGQVNLVAPRGYERFFVFNDRQGLWRVIDLLDTQVNVIENLIEAAEVSG